MASPRRCLAFATVLLAAVAGGQVSAETATPPVRTWDFRVLLDGKPIGAHRFSVDADGDATTVSGEASFAVKVLGLTAYRYIHEVNERWRGSCLTGLVAKTDDNGRMSAVRIEPREDRLIVSSPAGTRPIEGCVMSFAYWNPAIRVQTRLLNAQTGNLEAVSVQRIDDAPIEVRGKPVTARRYRIVGPAQPIDVWYTADGEWIGLDSKVDGRRQLSYRLQ